MTFGFEGNVFIFLIIYEFIWFSDVPWICAKWWKEKTSKRTLENAVFFECFCPSIESIRDFLAWFCRHLKTLPCVYPWTSLPPTFTGNFIRLCAFRFMHRGVQNRTASETKHFHITSFSSSTFTFKKGCSAILSQKTQKERGKTVFSFLWHCKGDPE